MEKAETDKVFASSVIFQLIALHENEKKNAVNVIVSLEKKDPVNRIVCPNLMSPSEFSM